MPDHRSASAWLLAGPVLCGVLLTAGCAPAGPDGAASPSTSVVVPAPTVGPGSTTPTAHPGPGAATAAPGNGTGARNLQVDDALREDLVTTWIRGNQLDRSDVVSTAKGSVYYAEQAASGTRWALADFEPSASAREKDRRLNGAAGDPLISFQDGPWLFTRPKDGSWKLVGDSGGQLCSSRVPADVASVWHLSDSC